MTSWLSPISDLVECKYRLRHDITQATLYLDIAAEDWAKLCATLPDSAEVKEVQARFSLPDFQLQDGCMGFASCWTWNPAQAGFKTMSYPLPPSLPGIIGLDPDHQALANAGATLEVVTQTLNRSGWHELETGQPAQLMELLLNNQPQLGGIGLAVTISRAGATLLRHRMETLDASKIHAAMYQAYAYFCGDHSAKLLERDFKVLFEPPSFVVLAIPGNAAGVATDASEHRETVEGFSLLPDNIDSWHQQFTLLFGLAELHQQLAR